MTLLVCAGFQFVHYVGATQCRNIRMEDSLAVYDICYILSPCLAVFIESRSEWVPAVLPYLKPVFYQGWVEAAAELENQLARYVNARYPGCVYKVPQAEASTMIC